MKINVIFILLFSLTFLFIGCENDIQPTESAMEVDEIESLEKGGRGGYWEKAHIKLGEKFTTAVANKDIDSFMECWWNSPKAVLVLENGWVVRGWDNIKAGMQGMMDAHKSLDLKVDYISRFRLRNCVFSVGLATWTMVDHNGVKTSFQEVWTDIATNIDGEWVFIMDHPHDLRPFPPQPGFPE